MNTPNFKDRKCTPCTQGAVGLTSEEIQTYLSELGSSWECLDSKKIQKKFSFSDFLAAMKFVHSVADIAEQEGHHPDIHIFYNKVTIELSTHSIGGLSENDFIVAAKIDAIG